MEQDRLTSQIFGKDKRYGGALRLDPRWDFDLIGRTINYSDEQFEELGKKLQGVFIKVTDIDALKQLDVPIHSVIKLADANEWLVTSEIPTLRICELRDKPFVKVVQIAGSISITKAEQ